MNILQDQTSVFFVLRFWTFRNNFFIFINNKFYWNLVFVKIYIILIISHRKCFMKLHFLEFYVNLISIIEKIDE